MNLKPNNKIEKYLDELSLEYKELLFKELIERSPSLEELSISELLRIDSEIKKPLLEKSITRRKRKLSIVGLTYIYLGICMLLISFVIKRISVNTELYMLFILLSVIIIISGGLSIVFSYLLTDKKSNKRIQNDTSKVKLMQYEIITTWRTIEGLYNDINPENNVRKIGDIISGLHNNGVINQSDVEILKSLIIMRNVVVHSSEVKYTIQEMEKLLNESERIINKIKKLI